MVVQSDLNRIKALLTEAVTVLCKNALSFGTELSIEGLLGITLDKQDVFLVSIHETSRKGFESPERTESAPVGLQSMQNAPQRIDSDIEEQLSEENDKPKDYHQSSSACKVKQEFNQACAEMDLDTPQDLSRVNRVRDWSPSRKRHKSNDALYNTSCQPLSCSSDNSMNPLDLIIKHERLSESDCDSIKNNISRQFNLSHASGSVQSNNSSIASSNKDEPSKADLIHIDKSSQDDNNSDYNNSDSSLNSTGWGQETSPFCIPGNLLPVSNQTPFSPSIGTAAVGQEITCPECGKLYWAGQWLRFRRHLATHEQRFCELCGVRCKNAQALRAHRYRHNKKQRIQDGPTRQNSEADTDARHSHLPAV